MSPRVPRKQAHRRVFLDRLCEIIDRLSQSLVGSFVPEEAAFGVGDVRIGMGCVHFGEPLLFPGREFRLDLVNDRPRYFTLQREDILNIVFVGLPPDALFGNRLHQLHVDADAIAGTKHGALHDSVYVQLTRDLGKRFMRSPVDQRRSL